MLCITSDGDGLYQVILFYNKYLQVRGSSEIFSATQIDLKIAATVQN